MHQPLRSSREAQQALASLVLDRPGPGRQLVVAERIYVCSIGQIRQRLFISHHDVACLHPRDVKLVGGAELSESQQRLRNTAACEHGRDAVERL